MRLRPHWISLVCAWTQAGNAHYVFSRFMFNDTVTEQWEYVRNITEGQAADSGLWDQYMPYYDLTSSNLRCGRGATIPHPGIKTARILAGATVGFLVGRSADEPLPPLIYHNGPGQAYLSLSPSANLSAYSGDGPWFKIVSLGAKNDTYWMTRDQPGMNFTIPERTPPGKYLLRVEHLYVRPVWNTTQFYIACAQVEVVGPGGGNPGPLVEFPGAYTLEDPGIWVDESMYEYPLTGLLDYVAPGPSVWNG
ncbi:lytic polysaccharide monooxygenase [Lentithecium fluviatile CBS 122367]|uniref:lytic cellulose monooxygenase (C4-dehydrogenating) n=1 Tax=Lentithecium fluviatile CBS 122367 TaxID=1168545 RepID=A0A6G1IUZ1_9PLEO|nr:lytic polysaccharide monooxygenase [Lentithecium fluviatile CBS 122367]